MSRWLAIWDKDGKIDPARARNAFAIYPWYSPPLFSEHLHATGALWMGAARFPMEKEAALQHFPDGKILLWDGTIYNDRVPAQGLETLSGRWSFLQYDPARHELWMARDRVGLKPLYYWTDGTRSVFASEPKLILALPFVEKAVNTSVVFDYFVLNKTDSQRDTLFKGIRQILPSHELRVDMNKETWKERPYYELPINTEVPRFDDKKAQQYLREVRTNLEEAIRIRIPEIPATLLSGGLDRSTLACIIAKKSAAPLTALTASYHEEAFGEQKWAKIVVDHLGAKWMQTFPTAPDLQADLEDFIFSQDTPTFSSGTYSQYCLFRMAAAEGIPAVFDGQGADSMFGGQSTHLPPLWTDLRRSGQYGALLSELRAYGPLHKAAAYWTTNWLKYNAIPSLPAFGQGAFKRAYFPELQLLNPDILEANRNRYVENVPAPDTLNGVLGQSYLEGPLAFLLKCLDRASAWAGVNTITPFADDANLMELAFSIPGIYKIHNGARKYLLRESFKDMVPAANYKRRDKVGLATPNNAWMAHLRPVVRQYIEEQDEAIFQKKKLLAACDQFFNPPHSLENYRVYKYLSFIVWRSVYKLG